VLGTGAGGGALGRREEPGSLRSRFPGELRRREIGGILGIMVTFQVRFFRGEMELSGFVFSGLRLNFDHIRFIQSVVGAGAGGRGGGGLGTRQRIVAANAAEGAHRGVAPGEETADAVVDECGEAGFVDGGFEGSGEVLKVVVAGFGAGGIGIAEFPGAVDLGDFDGAPAGESPVDVSDLIDDAGLDGGLRRELGEVGIEEFAEGDVVLDFDDRGGLGVAAMFERVHGRTGFALGSDGPIGFGTVDAGLIELDNRHLNTPENKIHRAIRRKVKEGSGEAGWRLEVIDKARVVGARDLFANGVTVVLRGREVGGTWGSRADRGVRPTGRIESSVQEVVGGDAGLIEDGAEGAFGEVAGVIGDRRVAVGLRVEPDFVAPGSLTIKAETEEFETACNFAITESSEAAHQAPQQS